MPVMPGEDMIVRATTSSGTIAEDQTIACVVFYPYEGELRTWCDVSCLHANMALLSAMASSLSTGDSDSYECIRTVVPLKVFDTIPVANSLQITKKGKLFCASDFSNHMLFHFHKVSGIFFSLSILQRLCARFPSFEGCCLLLARR